MLSSFATAHETMEVQQKRNAMLSRFTCPILKILVIKYGANFRVHLEDEVLLSQKKISGWFCL